MEWIVAVKMKYFTLVLLLAVVVAASAYPYRSYGKRKGGGGPGGAGKGGSGSGGKGSGGQGPGSSGSGGKGPGGQGPGSSGSGGAGQGGSKAQVGDQQPEQQQQQEPEGQQEEQGEKDHFGKYVSQECRDFLTDLYEYRQAKKEAEKAEEAAGDGEETRALKLLRELERELSLRQELEPPDDMACRDSFDNRFGELEAACKVDPDAEDCEGLEELDAAYTEYADLAGAEVRPIGAVCYSIVSHPFREKEEEEGEPAPERRKRQEEFIWHTYEVANDLIGSCWRVFWGPPEGEGEGQRQGKGQDKGQEKGQGEGQGGEQGGAPAGRELIDFLLRKIDGKRRF